MALTMERLKTLVEGEGLKYFVDPERDALMLGATGLNGQYHFLILLDLDGEFMQFRTLGYHSCPVQHAHLEATLKVLGELDYKLRFVKFGWDPSDGEIAVYGDAWILDGDVTQAQFSRMAMAFMSIMDMNYPRIDGTIKTGEDPGGTDPIEAARRAARDAGLPPELQKVVDDLLERMGASGSDDDEDDEETLDTI